MAPGTGFLALANVRMAVVLCLMALLVQPAHAGLWTTMKEFMGWKSSQQPKQRHSPTGTMISGMEELQSWVQARPLLISMYLNEERCVRHAICMPILQGQVTALMPTCCMSSMSAHHQSITAQTADMPPSSAALGVSRACSQTR